MMARNVKSGGSASIVDRIVAIRDLWHTKNHPFFRVLADGKLPLKSLGRYQALHYQYVSRAAPSFGVFYTRAYHLEDVRKMIAENVAEEEGLKAIDVPGHEAQDHNELLFRFCRAVGLSDAEVKGMKMTPAWWGRSLHYYQVTTTEPIGVALAMQSTQEGQMPALMTEIVLPAFERHYGYKRSAPEIAFFTEHAEADVEHSRKQMELCAKYLDTPELRWASVSELYRAEVLGEKELLPPGVG
jgi:pyrroloquinoline quinone (PQQ) biosynthesis protein C